MAAQLTVDIPGLGRAASIVEALLGALADRRPLMEAIGGYLEASTRQRFDQGVGPGGKAWAPNHRGGQVLRDTGRLMNSLTHEARHDEVSVGTNVIYAAAHQFGATIEPVTAKALHFVINGRHVTTQRVTLPARPFLGIDAEDEAEILDIAEGFYARLWGAK